MPEAGELFKARQTYYEGRQFQDLELVETIIEGMTFIDCEFIDCMIRDCELVNCSFSDCTLRSCTIANLKISGLSQAQGMGLDACDLIGFDWSDLAGKNILFPPITQVRSCLLKYNTFEGIDLRGFDFSGTAIVDSFFSRCCLVESSFSDCNLDRTEFVDCDLRKADFRQAVGYRIDPLTNIMKGSRFSLAAAAELLAWLGIEIDL